MSAEEPAVVPRSRFALPVVPEVATWRPIRVGFYWLLLELSYLTVWWTLGPDAIKGLFLYLAPKP